MKLKFVPREVVITLTACVRHLAASDLSSLFHLGSSSHFYVYRSKIQPSYNRSTNGHPIAVFGGPSSPSSSQAVLPVQYTLKLLCLWAASDRCKGREPRRHRPRFVPRPFSLYRLLPTDLNASNERTSIQSPSRTQMPSNRNLSLR